MTFEELFYIFLFHSFLNTDAGYKYLLGIYFYILAVIRFLYNHVNMEEKKIFPIITIPACHDLLKNYFNFEDFFVLSFYSSVTFENRQNYPKLWLGEKES